MLDKHARRPGDSERPVDRRVIVPLDVAALVPLQMPRGAEVVALGGETMGTTWSVKYVGASPLSAGALDTGIKAILDGIIAQMSPWIEDSNITRFNRAPSASWHTLPDDFFRVLTCALSVARQSDGAYDPTIGALIDLWGFGPSARPRQAPSADQIAAAMRRCGWRGVTIDQASRAFQPGVELDFSSIAKGFAVDKVSSYLISRGVTHHLVEIGGELTGQGIKPDGSPWWVAVDNGRGTTADSPRAFSDLMVALHGLSIATSGDNVRYFEQDGVRFSHTIDPRSGYAVRNALTSVTVLHRSCMYADAFATALYVLGPDQGFDFASRNNLAARFVSRKEYGLEERITPTLDAMLS